MRKKYSLEAFTLIELLVVISIIGLLSSIVITSLSTSREKARDVAKIKTIREIRNALELFSSAKGYYPSSFDFVSSLTSNKHIDSLDENVIYKGISSSGLECSQQFEKCHSYHMGIVLERTDNPALKIDSDSGDIFSGISTNCDNNGGVERCYDIKP